MKDANLRFRSRLLPASLGLVLALAALTAPARAAQSLPALASPATNVHIPGKFVWFDLATSDPVAAQRFYGEVFGWTFTPLRGSPERYVVVRNENRPIAGFFRPVNTPEGSTTGRWLSFASVGDLDAALSRLTAAGATVLVPATKVDGRGTHVIVRDPQGAIFGLLRSDSGDPPDEPVPPGGFFWVDLYTRDPAAAARMYAGLGLQVSRDTVSGEDRIVLSANGHARAGIMQLPDVAREAGLLPYVQVDDVPATLTRVRAAGGHVLREPDPAVLGGQLAVFADPMGGVLGIVNWLAAEQAAGGAQ